MIKHNQLPILTDKKNRQDNKNNNKVVVAVGGIEPPTSLAAGIGA